MEPNIDLKKYTTFKVSAECKFFKEINSEKEILDVFDFIEKNKLDFFILGGGSNLLLSDKTKDLFAIKVCIKGFSFQNNILNVGSGEFLSKIVNESIKNQFKGLEWAAGIPGSVGGAIFGNSGSFGGEIKDNLINVKVFCIDTKEFKILSNLECNFFYRDSIFKQKRNRYIILDASFKLIKQDSNENILEIFTQNLKKKKETQPINEFSAGCLFKNIIFDEKNKKLVDFLMDYSQFEDFKLKKQIPAGFLIDKLGLKNLNVNEAVVSDIHANFIVNKGNATYFDIIKLINLIKQEVYIKLHVKLEEEIEVV